MKNAVEVTAKKEPTTAEKLAKGQWGAVALSAKDPQAKEAIERYLKAHGTDLAGLEHKPTEFRKQVYGLITESFKAGDWSKMKAPRFDPLQAKPKEKPAEIVVDDPIEEERPNPASKSQKCDSDSRGDAVAGELADMIRRVVGTPKTGLNEERFKELFDHEIKNGIAWGETGVVKLLEDRIEAAKNGIARRIEIILPDGERKETERQHKGFDTLLKLCSLRKNVMLVGPAASGKTTVAENVAKVLDLPFHPMSVGLQTSKGDLMGIKFADGSYQPSPLRKAYEHGGVILLDEFDAGHAGVNTIINAAIANAVCGFPDGTVERHKDFICIVAMNTWGWGANDQYVGRNKLDAATLDRFLKLPWEYDEELEREIAGNREWSDRVQALRRAAAKVQAKVLISPRASINGADLLAAGFGQGEVEDMTIWNGVDRATKEKVLSNVE